MGRQYEFSILKNYPMERGYVITGERDKTVIDRLKSALKGK